MMALVLFLALVLAVSAGHKLMQRQRLTAATARLAGVPLPLGGVLLALSAAWEVLAAMALMLAPLRAGGALAAAGLWALYGMALIRRSGEVLDCGCELAARARPVTPFQIARPLVLAILALAVAAAPAPLWPVDAPFAGLALLALWFAAAELSALPVVARTKT